MSSPSSNSPVPDARMPPEEPENFATPDELASSTSTDDEDDDMEDEQGHLTQDTPLELDPEDDDDDEEEDEEGAEQALAKGLIKLQEGGKDAMDVDAEEEEDSSKEEEINQGDEDVDEPKEEEEGAEGAANNSSSNENNNKQDQLTSYSTRGRAQTSSQEENAFERLAAVGDLLAISNSGQHHHHQHHREIMPTLLHTTEPTTTRMRESFLSDSLTEEERRTRTRYLPNVEGMHALRKHEIKGDLALARSTLSASGATERLTNKSSSTAAASNKRNNNKQATDEDAAVAAAAMMDTEGGGAALSGEDNMMSEEDRLSATGVSITKTIEIGSTELSLPSPAFVAPAPESSKRPTPREVEAVVAFNPPRPPESIGAKKKHRMLRWERRPADIEVDLSNYRKTVQRTREELKSAQDERERIITVDNQLRHHFLQHIKCMNEELLHLGDEIAAVQQECVDVADLPSSRTRTRGAFKGSTVMRDVLHTLRAKGKEIEAKGLVVTTGSSFEPGKVRGAGGVAATSFVDWNRSTVIEPCKFAQAWIVPGDRVQTPYGEGTMVAFYGPAALNREEAPRPDLFPKTVLSVGAPKDDAMDVESTESSPPQPTEAAVAPGKKKAPKATKKKEPPESSGSLVNVLAPRVAVRLPFGVAFFNLDSVVSIDDPSKFTDDQMAKRWIGIAETATALGSTLDVGAMANLLPSESGGDAVLESPVAMEGAAHDEENVGSDKKRRLVPFGAGLLPTAVGRGTLLHKANISELDETVDKAFFKGHGILGMRDNIGVPSEVRKLEDQRQEHLILQAKVLQLRNQLYRQRRIRMLNERTYAASQERASRVESLVAEMRTDLKSLKGRLDLEIRDLGISEEQAEHILKSFYMSLDSQHSGDASPPKRLRRFSRMDGDDEEMEEAETTPYSEVAESLVNTETDEPGADLPVDAGPATAEQ